MLCTDIRVDDWRIREAFVEAWNELVDRGVVVGEDGSGTQLERYRARDLRELIERMGRIEQVEDWLVRRTLERIEMGVDGIRVRWLAEMDNCVFYNLQSLLEGGYVLGKVRPLDMYPWEVHA